MKKSHTERAWERGIRAEVSDVLINDDDEDRRKLLRFFKSQIKRLMKRGEWLYVENGTPKQGSKGL